MLFSFQALINGKKYPFALFFYFLLLETAPKTQHISKFTKEQEMFAKWTKDGVQHQFKNLLIWTLFSRTILYSQKTNFEFKPGLYFDKSSAQ
jgi:hypothetical protein